MQRYDFILLARGFHLLTRNDRLRKRFERSKSFRHKSVRLFLPSRVRH